MEDRIEPMSNVVCIWRDGYGGYPEGVKIAFRDGKIIRFWREIEQPAPNVVPEYHPKHLKKDPPLLQQQRV